MCGETIFKLADYIINYSAYLRDKNTDKKRMYYGITNRELQWIVYMIDSDLSRRGKRLLNCKSESWRLGACYPDIYFKYSKYGSIPLTNSITEPDKDVITSFSKKLGEDKDVVDKIIEKFSFSYIWDAYDLFVEKYPIFA